MYNVFASGGVCGFMAVLSLLLMKGEKRVGFKLLIGFGAFLLSVAICYILAVAILSLAV